MSGNKPKDFEYGELNKISAPIIPDSLHDPDTATFDQINRERQKNKFTVNSLKNRGRWLAIVLRVENDAASAADPDAWYSLETIREVFEDTTTPPRQILRVMIPEIHPAPNPGLLALDSSEGTHQGRINNFYPIVVAESTGTPAASPGDKVWVRFEDFANLKDGVYLGPVFGEPTIDNNKAPPSASRVFTASGKGKSIDCKAPTTSIGRLWLWDIWAGRKNPEKYAQEYVQEAVDLGATDLAPMMCTTPTTGAKMFKNWANDFEVLANVAGNRGLDVHLVIWTPTNPQDIREQAREVIPVVNAIRPRSVQFDMEGEWIQSSAARRKINEETVKDAWRSCNVPITITSFRDGIRQVEPMVTWAVNRTPRGAAAVQAYSTGKFNFPAGKTQSSAIKKWQPAAGNAIVMGLATYGSPVDGETRESSLIKQINCSLAGGIKEIALWQRPISSEFRAALKNYKVTDSGKVF